MNKYERMKDALTDKILSIEEKRLKDLKSIRSYIYHCIITDGMTLDDAFYYVADLLDKVEKEAD